MPLTGQDILEERKGGSMWVIFHWFMRCSVPLYTLLCLSLTHEILFLKVSVESNSYSSEWLTKRAFRVSLSLTKLLFISAAHSCIFMMLILPLILWGSTPFTPTPPHLHTSTPALPGPVLLIVPLLSILPHERHSAPSPVIKCVRFTQNFAAAQNLSF